MIQGTSLRRRPNHCYRDLVQTRHATQLRQKRAQRRVAGGCTRCVRQAAAGRSLCAACLVEGRERSRRWRETA